MKSGLSKTERFNNIKNAKQDDNRIKQIEDEIKEFDVYFNSEEYEEDMTNELGGL